MNGEELIEVKDVSGYWDEDGRVASEELSPEINVHDLKSSINGHTIRLKGVLQDKDLSILVDYGSTHSFI